MTKNETAAYLKSLAAVPAPEKALSDSIPAVIAINTVIVADKK